MNFTGTELANENRSQLPSFNLFDPTWRADPYPLYRRLRTEAPVGIMPALGIWYFTRYADCLALLRDTRAGCDTRKSEVYRNLTASGALRMPDNLRSQRSFLFLDPPDHTRLRRLVASAFTANIVSGLRERVQQLVTELLDAAVERGHFDIVSDFAYPLPFTIICELLGIPVHDQNQFRGWSEELISSMDPQLHAPPELVRRQTEAIQKATAYLLELISERRENPSDDLLTALFRAEEAGDKLTDDELLSTVILLFAAGQETTVNLISNAVLALLTHPEQASLLRKQPSLARSAVEEILRWDAPTQMTQRVALEEIGIGGVTVKKGVPMVLILAAANRDEAQLSDGEQFDISRPHIPHLAFGFGAHFCLGAPLARLEGEIALSTLFSRFPDLRLADGVRRRDTLVMRGLAALPVKL